MTKTTRYAANTAAAGLAAIALGLAAPAGAYTVSGTLLGDPRGDPDGLKVIVTVEVGVDGIGGFDAQDCAAGTGASCSHWTVDLDMAGVHDEARLHEFYFNVGQVGEESKFDGAVFDDFDPTGWTVSDMVSEQGGGTWSPQFMFEADKENNGPPFVTNAQSLTFTMTLASDSFDISGPDNDFIGPNPLRLSTNNNNDIGGPWQMAAHLGGIGANGEDSGLAVGNFNGEPPDNPPGVPEPGTMALFGLGLVGLRLARRRRMA